MGIDFLITTLFFILSFPFGIVLLSSHFKKGIISRFELVVFGEIIGISISSLLIFFLSNFISLQISSILVVILGFSLLVFNIKNQLFIHRKINLKKLLILFNIFWILVFGYVISETHLKPIGDTLNGSPSTYGDLPFHLGIITNFTYGHNFPPVNPIAPFTRLSYHFVADFISSILLGFGSSLRGAIIFPSLFLGILIVNSLYLLSLRITKNYYVSLITPLIFLFNGGIGFLKIFESLFKGEFTPQLLFGGLIRFAHIPELGVEYPNILTELMMAERALLIGVPLWIASIFFLYIWYKERNKKSLFLAGIITGLLPYANIYAFLVNGFIFSLIFFNKVFTKYWRSILKEWLILGCLVLLIASPFFIWIFPQVTAGGSFIRFSVFEWPPMDHPYKALFWLTNFGVVPVLMLVAFFTRKIIGKNEKIFLGSIALVTLASHFIVFQPYAWDNNRFIIYPYISVSILASCLVAFLLNNRKIVIKFFGILMIVISILTGVLVMINDPQIHYSLYSENEFLVAEKIRLITDPKGIFLTTRNHNNIISSLAGRRIVLGFGGYLWTHGIQNTEETEQEMSDVYTCKGDTEYIINKLNIRYILIGPWEKSDYKDLNEECLTSKFKTILEENDIKLLDTKYSSNGN